MSTIIGVIFFVAILFTCVFPFWLVKIQYDAFYDKEVAAVAERDYLRHLENIKVYATNISRNEIAVEVKSDCGLEIDILRMWVNSSSYVTLNTTLQPMTTLDLGTYIAEDGLRTITVTTKRGNIFKSQSILVMQEPSLIAVTIFGVSSPVNETDFIIPELPSGKEVKFYLDDLSNYLNTSYAMPDGLVSYNLNFNTTVGEHVILARYFDGDVSNVYGMYINVNIDGTVDKLL